MPASPLEKAKTRTVEKSRVIAGILSEIDAVGAIMMLSTDAGGEPASARLTCDFRVPFDTSTLTISNLSVAPGVYTSTILFAGQRLVFALEVLDSEGRCKFPTRIDMFELRRGKRKRFGPEIQFAEIGTKRGIVMATPIDICQDAISLRLRSADAELSRGELVRLRIRGDTTVSDIYSAKMTVTRVYDASDGRRVLLAPFHKDRPHDSRRAMRQAAPSMTLTVAPLDDHLGAHIVVSLLNVSLTGCLGQFASDGISQGGLAWMTPGVSVKLGDESLPATVVRQENDIIAIQLEALDDPGTLAAWAKTLRRYKIVHGYDHSQVDDIVQLFTESGLLKGKRRKVYGESPAGLLPSELVTSNPMLYNRIVANGDLGGLIGHMSLARFSEGSWYFQEGAHNGTPGPSFRELYIQVIQTAQFHFGASESSPRFLTGLFHANIKSAGEFGVELFADPSSRVYPLCQFSITSNHNPSLSPSQIKVTSLIDLNADERRAVLNTFDATLVETFAGSFGQHPRLNAELAKLGPNHKAETALLSDDHGPWGLAYRLNTYYAFNSTGVMNGLFLVVKATVTASQILGGLTALLDQGMTIGTDDAAVIVDGPIDVTPQFTAGLKDPKPFTFFIIDNHLNREFLGGQTEPTNPALLRKKTR